MDLLIIGAGIAGLHVATRYLKKHPTHSVCIVERNGYLGGRIYTHHQQVPGKGEYQWEAGAGRIALTHHRVIDLIREYDLTFTKWSKQGERFIEKGAFPSLLPIYLKPLLSLKPSVLAQNTLDTLLQSIYGTQKATAFMLLFPYWAEFHTLRADIALAAFLDGPLGGHTGYGGCVEGLSALTDRMGKDITQRGGTIRLNTSLLGIQDGKGDLKEQEPIRVLVQCNNKKEWLHAKKVVLAMDATSLQKIKSLRDMLPVLRHLTTEPLLRTYAVFPGLVPPSKPSLFERGSMLPLQVARPQGGDKLLYKGGISWFSDMEKQVVPGPIRFFIPMDAAKGLAMISYTEGRDASHWMDMPEKRREKETMKALRAQYPDRDIPDPIAIKFHGWRSGCTYWVPSSASGHSGPYDVEEESDKSVQPIPGRPLYICSESFAVQQSWMESALVQAEKVLERMLRS